MIRFIECNIYPEFYWVEIDRSIQDTIPTTYLYYLSIPKIDQNTAYYLIYRFNRNNHVNTPVFESGHEFPWCAAAAPTARRYIQSLITQPLPQPPVVKLKKRADLTPSPIPAMLTKLAPRIATTYLKKLSGEK